MNEYITVKEAAKNGELLLGRFKSFARKTVLPEFFV